MKKIMIADDSVAVRIEVVKILKAEGFEIVEAVDGMDAVKKAANHPDIKLIILDYNMPNMDGLEAAKEFRRMEGFANVPMAMLTTESNSLLKAKGKDLGIAVWIVKPINPKSLGLVAHKLTD